MGLSLKVVRHSCLKNTVLTFKEQQQNITPTAYLDAINKGLAKHLFKPMDAQELQDPEKVSAIWVKIHEDKKRRTTDFIWSKNTYTKHVVLLKMLVEH